MKLNELKPNKGARKKRKRIGFGIGSGHGKTSTKGNKGQNARKHGNKAGFEGGQMTLVRRTPKRGFTNIFKTKYAIVNVSELNRFENGETVDIKSLIAKRLIDNSARLVKVLGNGELKKKVIVVGAKVSKSAAEKIKAVLGEVK
ncbi:MAG: 50S ribosomal protein L15 [Candidatus Firestonebacteria bacterium]|jgi:large subunit ribosomal protein L15|nr:50S ribosomal protein L15 [Candidatus Firestonebacteria bacterium]